MARDARNNTGKFDCQVERRNTLPVYNNYDYMDVHFSAKLFPTRINKWSLPSFQNSLKILTKRFACNINFLYLRNF